MNVLYQNESELQEACDAWSSVLRLTDWRIVCRLVDIDQITDGAGGEIFILWKKKVAEIKLLRPSHLAVATQIQRERDMELDLVHELMHIHVDWPFEYTDDADHHNKAIVFREQSVEQLALAFVAMHRSKPC